MPSRWPCPYLQSLGQCTRPIQRTFRRCIHCTKTRKRLRVCTTPRNICGGETPRSNRRLRPSATGHVATAGFLRRSLECSIQLPLPNPTAVNTSPTCLLYTSDAADEEDS